MFKKSHRNEKKVIFDIFLENYRTFSPENSDLKYSCTTLINGKNQSPGEVFSSSTAIIAVNRTVAKTCDKQCPITVRRSVHNCQETELKVDRHCRARAHMFGHELVPKLRGKIPFVVRHFEFLTVTIFCAHALRFFRPVRPLFYGERKWRGAEADSSPRDEWARACLLLSPPCSLITRVWPKRETAGDESGGINWLLITM